MIHLLYTCTKNYLHKGQPALASAKNIDAKRWLVCYEFQPTPFLRSRYPHLECVHMPTTPYASHGMIQAGQWLDVITAADADVLIVSDADILAQRDITQAERERFEAYDTNTLGLAWNCGTNDNLYEEAWRIQIAQEAWQRDYPCWNCGLIVGKVGAWRRLRAEYEQDWQEWRKKTDHRCRIQWFVCYCIRRARMGVDLLPDRVHSHGHFHWPQGVHVRGDGVAYSHDDVIMFRHKF